MLSPSPAPAGRSGTVAPSQEPQPPLFHNTAVAAVASYSARYGPRPPSPSPSNDDGSEWRGAEADTRVANNWARPSVAVRSHSSPLPERRRPNISLAADSSTHMHNGAATYVESVSPVPNPLPFRRAASVTMLMSPPTPAAAAPFASPPSASASAAASVPRRAASIRINLDEEDSDEDGFRKGNASVAAARRINGAKTQHFIPNQQQQRSVDRYREASNSPLEESDLRTPEADAYPRGNALHGQQRYSHHGHQHKGSSVRVSPRAAGGALLSPNSHSDDESENEDDKKEGAKVMAHPLQRGNSQQSHGRAASAESASSPDALPSPDFSPDRKSVV